ncbi:MAG TPA: DUF1501 domain-containing protein [Steroidobacteraceae bacterium]
MKPIDRRDFLRGGALATAAAGLAGSGALLTTRVVFAGAQGPLGLARGAVRDPRLVLIILRGAMDGLAAVPPCGDPEYMRLREGIALPTPGVAGGALALDGTFALHPSFGFLHECYGAGELIVFHAVASPYRARSHFDGQDVLENGTSQPHALRTGWLNRALVALPALPERSVARDSKGGPRQLGVALGQNVPLVMRGPAEVASWAPSRLAPLDDDTLARIEDLYASDPLLARRLADALAAQAMADAGGDTTMLPPSAERFPLAQPAAKPAGRYTEIIRAAAGFLRREDGPRIAVFDTNGWDTHANEGGAQGALGQRFGVLDSALRAFKEDLGPAWRETAIVLATEFGRTAAVNGTRGTDHGTATASLLLGGAVRGGRVVADWPGLSERVLHDGRDLAPTLDLRSVLKGLLHEQLGIPPRALEDSVFPQSAQAPPLKDLLRT